MKLIEYYKVKTEDYIIICIMTIIGVVAGLIGMIGVPILCILVIMQEFLRLLMEESIAIRDIIIERLQ